VSRRRTRRRSPARKILATGLFAFAGLAFLAVWRDQRAEKPVARRAPPDVELPVRPASLREPVRAVYPYSVLRGGAWSRGDLAGRLADDAVAATHYRGFRTTEARIVRLSQAQRAYVSYRMNDAVYWTRAPVVIPVGEAVLTDGESMARARCGNRLSAEPRLPVGKEVDLDTPEIPPMNPDLFSDRPLLVFDLFPPAVIEGRESIAAIAEMPAYSVTDQLADHPPAPPALGPLLHLPSAWPPQRLPPILPPPGPPPVPPAADSPEPSTLFLFLGAGAAVLAIRRAMR
jgi:hypothetical protein